MTEERIPPLRRRMTEDMSVRHFTSKTQHDYIRTVMKLTRFLGRSPDTATNEDLRRFQLQPSWVFLSYPAPTSFAGYKLGPWTICSCLSSTSSLACRRLLS